MSNPLFRASEARIAERDARLSALGPCPPWWRPFARRAWHRSTAALVAMDVSLGAEMLARMYPTAVALRLAQRRSMPLGMLRKEKP